MPSIARRPVWIALACVLVALGGYLLWPRDAARIESLLKDSLSELNRTSDPASLAELQRFLRGALLPTATVRIAELDLELDGVDAITARARDLLAGPPLKFGWIGLEAKVSGRLATVDADLVVAVRGGAEQRPQLRRTRVRLAKRGEAWQIEAVEVDAVAPSEPEARP